MIQVWILSLLLNLSLAFSKLHVDPSKFHAFPKDHIAGVFQVHYKNQINQLTYAFNASEARDVCSFLGVTLASIAQVEEAQKQGLETCRFGWIDEHFAVIPRILPSLSCGKNQTGVIKWRAPVTTLFDVFCFNISAIHLEDTTADSLLTTQEQLEGPRPPSSGVTSSPPTSISTTISHLPRSTHSAQPTSPSSLFPLSVSPSASIHHSDNPEEVHPSLSNKRFLIGAVPTVLLITFAFVILLTAMAILWYFRKGQKKDYTETEDWKHTCMKETKNQQNESATEPDDEVCKEIAKDVRVNIRDDTNTKYTSEIEP
uniref:Link domain-containing protein n=2 Tax=Esox lucius TaxID=8010 RepID=A0A3P8YJ08_ESOLU